ncbi:hypothetical protein E2C01_001088 [Portunus trituberculatus]|uniref:Uncharacterized protein n=1 Tax=Portunus trituberculatus TaxID=210409 RepID=A0A5B7CID6_PORTR|nr:hypothetical protein [Portunus trituberculatus]
MSDASRGGGHVLGFRACVGNEETVKAEDGVEEEEQEAEERRSKKKGLEEKRRRRGAGDNI